MTPSATPLSPSRKEIAFVDTAVADWQTLVAGIRPGIEVVLLDGNRDGLAQMAQWAEGKSGYDAIHVLSHGAEGQVRLGSATLDDAALTARAQELATLGAMLSEEGDLLFYGCNVAAGQAGVDFVQRLAQASGADVATSDNRTGSTKLNGDWRLEVASGEIATTPLESSSFTGTLAPVSFTGDTGTVTDATVSTGSKSTITMTIGSDTLSIVSEGNKMYLDNKTNLGGDIPTGMTDKYIKTTNDDWTKSITFRVDGGKIFDFVSMSLQESNGDADTFKFIPNGDAAKAVTSSYTATQHKLIDLSSNPDFDNLTSLTITTNDALFQVNLDSIILENIRLPAPTVTGVTSSTANGSYNAGDVISIQVTFSESVTVIGTPQLTLETGSTGRTVNYVSGSPGTTLTFNYTVQAGDTSADLDYATTGALTLNGGSINATSGGATATLTLPTPGAANSLGANKAIVIDTAAPGAPSTPDMAAGADSGSSGTDNITSNTTPTFTGTAEAGATVKLYSGATEIGSGTATGGNWSITTSALSAGIHTITAQATDAAGNVSVVSTGLPITIDTAAPAAPSMPTMTSGTDSGVSNSDSVTSDTTPIFTGTAEAGSTVTLYDTNGTTSIGTASADGSGNWTITASTLSAGAHTLTAKATDAAGNVSSASSGLSVTIDTTAPTLTVSTLSFSADTGSSSSDFITQTAAQTISGTLSGVTATGDIVEVSFDNGSTWATASNTIGQNSWSLAGQTLTASNTLKVRVTDAAGNTGTAASQAYVLDTTAPSVTAVSIPATTMKVGATVTATITVADDGGVAYTLGSGTIGGFTLSNLTRSNSTTYTADFTVTEGGTEVAADSDIPVSLVLTDLAGNSNTAYTTAISQGGDAINAHSPTDIALSNTSVATIAGTNAVVGALTSTDATSSETFTYSLVAGAGSTDNASFNISGNDLRANDANGLTAGNSYNVRVRTTDAAGNSFDEAFTVNAVNNPTVTGITSSTANGSYKAGDVISIQVTFSESVTVDTTGGTPQLTLETGTTDRTVNYVSGSPGATLTFNYTVQAGDTSTDLDYIATNPLALNGSTIHATAGGTAATLALPAPGTAGSLGANKAIVTDTTPPAVISIDRQNPASATTNADTLVYRVTFGEAVGNVDAADFSVSGSTATVTGVTSASGNAYDVTVAGGNLANVNDTVTLGFAGGQNITDTAGNALASTTPTGTNNASYTLDNTAPTVTSIDRQNPASATTNADALVYRVAFGEAVSNVDAADFSVSGSTATVTGVTSAGGNAYDVTVAGGDLANANSTVTLGFAGGQNIADTAGNALASTTPTGTNNASYTLDNTAPTFTSATVNGNQLVMTYTEATTLDATNTPLFGAFAVLAGATTHVVTGIAVNAAAKTVTLTLASAVAAGQTVTVAYTDPTGTNDVNAIQDAVGNDAASLSATAVTNNTAAPPPPPPPPPDDDDGVDSEVEDKVPGIPSPGGVVVPGDGNGDGVADGDQSAVASVPFLVTTTAQSNPGNAPPVYVTLVASSQEGKVPTGSGTTSALHDVRQLDAPANKPTDVQMPLGLISFKADVHANGATESFSLYVDDAVEINGYWKKNAQGSWVNLASADYGGQLVHEGDKWRLDFELQDGGEFDSDGDADGVITDPGAPGKQVQAPPPADNDSDRDQFPDALEAAHSLSVGVKDNDVFASTKFYAMQLYRDTLFREAEDAGLAYWKEVLDSGAKSRVEVADAFLNSPEFQAHAGALARLYFAAFDRIPDEAGMTHWMEQLHNQGQTLKQVAQGFADSSEFQAQYGALDNTGFLKTLYQNVLGRAPDEAGLAYWLGQLSGGTTRGEVLAGFAQSGEYKVQMREEVAVTLLYVGLLGRSPEQGGYEHWLDQITSQGDALGAMEVFIQSDEYHDRFLPTQRQPQPLEHSLEETPVQLVGVDSMIA